MVSGAEYISCQERDYSASQRPKRSDATHGEIDRSAEFVQPVNL